MKHLLLSVAIGDIGGMPYEEPLFHTKAYDQVNLLHPRATYTDDTVCTFACAEALLDGLDMAECLWKRGRADFYRGFGGHFYNWLRAPQAGPAYNSYGNGSAMRCAAAGFMATSREECIRLATQTAMPTHNHPEGIKGAVATALAIFYAMQGRDKAYIRANVLEAYYPDWATRTYDAIHPTYKFEISCQETVPAALISFLESTNYVDCLKRAIALGGDADTLAAIAGPMAYALYREMPQALIDNARSKLPAWILRVSDDFDRHCADHSPQHAAGARP